VEQKNWPHVRKLVGWDRDDSAEALQALNALYADLRLFQNLFQPSMKLLTKVRKGSRLIRRYDRPQTPFARVCACPEADPEKVAALRRVLAHADPFALSQRIDRHLDRLYRLASQAGPEPRAVPTRPRRSPWYGWTFSRRALRPSQASAQPTGKNPARTVGSGATISRPAKGEARGKTAARGAEISGKIFRWLDRGRTITRDIQPYSIASYFAGWLRSRKHVSSSLLDDNLSSFRIQADSIAFFQSGGNARHIRNRRQPILAGNDGPV